MHSVGEGYTCDKMSGNEGKGNLNRERAAGIVVIQGNSSYPGRVGVLGEQEWEQHC